MRKENERGRLRGVRGMSRFLVEALLVLLLAGCGEGFWQEVGDEPADTTISAVVDSMVTKPDSYYIRLDTSEMVPDDLTDPYWTERQDTLNPDNFIVVLEQNENGTWQAPDTIKGRILELAALIYLDNGMVGCQGMGCDDYGFPASDTVSWQQGPAPEPEPEPEPTLPDTITTLAASVTETLTDSVEVYATWDTDGEHVVTVCCRTGGSSWPGTPYPPDLTVTGTEATFRVTRMNEDVEMTVCVTQVEYAVEVCEQIPVPGRETASQGFPTARFASFSPQQQCEPRLITWQLFMGDRYRVSVQGVGTTFHDDLSSARESAFREKVSTPEAEVLIFDTRPLEVVCDE